MLSLIPLFVVLYASSSFSSAQSQCATPKPLSLPIKNVTIANGIKRRGFALDVGTPAQSMALAINADWNNTIIYSSDGRCSNLPSAHCTFSRGGAFNSSASTTWDVPPDPSAAEFRMADHGSLSVAAYGADTIFLDTSAGNLTAFPLFTPSAGELPQSGLGLGRHSTFLEGLHAAGMIASQTWSLFWGLEGGDSADVMDGSLTLGGYDAAKTNGANITQPFSSLADMAQCPSSLIVFVTDIVVKHPNGTTTSLFGTAKGTALRTCVKPDIPLITFPSDIWHAFSNAIGGTYIGPSESYKLWGMDYDTHGIFDGDLQFVLSSGLELTVPNSQLVVPDVQVNDNGQMQIPNDTTKEILVYNLEDSNENDMPLLGQAFLTSVYMHVDNEREQFTLWQAKATTNQDLVTVLTANLSNCTSLPVGTGQTSNSTTPRSQQRHPPSAGVIAGSVIGSIAALVLCMIFVALFLRRRKRTAPLPSGRKSLQYDTHKEMVVTGYGPRHAYETLWQPRPQAGSRADPPEVEGTQVHEMPHDQWAHRYELYAGGSIPQPASS